MPYQMQIKTADRGWVSVSPSKGAPYEYDTEKEARRMLDICYPDLLSEKKRTLMVREEAEFKVGDTVHFHAYTWYDPQPREVIEVLWHDMWGHPVDRPIYNLDGTNKTAGHSIVESKHFIPPVH